MLAGESVSRLGKPERKARGGPQTVVSYGDVSQLCFCEGLRTVSFPHVCMEYILDQRDRT